MLVAPLVAGCQDRQHPERPSRARAELRRPGDSNRAKTARERSGEALTEWKNLFHTEDGLPRTPSSFLSAKHKALEIFADHRTTFYCSCTFGEDKSVAPDSCGYQARKNAKRGSRIEWEHIVPAHAFGGHRECWTEKICTKKKSGKKYRGRACCGKVDEQFRKMEADLQNLVPAVGELNGDRANYRFGEVDGEPRVYGACDFEVDFDSKLAEPTASVRGPISTCTTSTRTVCRSPTNSSASFRSGTRPIPPPPGNAPETAALPTSKAPATPW